MFNFAFNTWKNIFIEPHETAEKMSGEKTSRAIPLLTLLLGGIIISFFSGITNIFHIENLTFYGKLGIFGLSSGYSILFFVITNILISIIFHTVNLFMGENNINYKNTLRLTLLSSFIFLFISPIYFLLNLLQLSFLIKVLYFTGIFFQFLILSLLLDKLSSYTSHIKYFIFSIFVIIGFIFGLMAIATLIDIFILV
ncbi:MAG: YIP1 family protein [Bacillota bacterium]